MSKPIFVVKVCNEWGEDKGTFAVTTSKSKLTRIVRKYMRALKLEFQNGYTLQSIVNLVDFDQIEELNKSLQGCCTKGKECLDDYTLYIQSWENGEIDESFI